MAIDLSFELCVRDEPLFKLSLTDRVDGDQPLDGGRGRELDEGEEDDLHCGLGNEGSEHTLARKANVIYFLKR